MSARGLARASVVAAVLFVANTAFAQPVVQVGSGGESGGAREGWVFGAGYNFDFAWLPLEVGALAQSGTGIETAGGREFPVRTFLTARMGMLPLPGFGVYIGGGGGIAARLGGDSETGITPAGMAFAGFEVGRLHLEVQLQREFHEEPVNRWVTAIGVTF